MQFEVYSKRGRVSLRSQLPLISEGAPRKWIHVARAGKWEGHRSGAFEFNADTFARVLENFKRNENAIPLTYEHPDYDADGSPIPAAGWIHDFQVRANGAELWALVEFTPRAAAMVRGGEYRFCSVVIDFNATDRKTGDEIGPEIVEVGLVNLPFIDGLEPIKLGRNAAGRNKRMSDVKLLNEAMEALGKDATLSELVKWAEARKLQIEVEDGEKLDAAPAADDVSASDPAPDAVSLEADGEGEGEESPATSNAAADLVDTIAALAGVSMDEAIAAMQEQAEAIAAMVGSAPDDGAEAEEPAFSKAARERIAELEAKLSAVEAERAEAEVDKAIAAGAFGSGSRDKLVAFARRSPEDFRAAVEASREVKLGKSAYSARPPAKGKETDLTEDDLDANGATHFRFLRAAGIEPGKALRLAKEKQDEADSRRN